MIQQFYDEIWNSFIFLQRSQQECNTTNLHQRQFVIMGLGYPFSTNILYNMHMFLLWELILWVCQVCVNEGLWAHSIHQIASYLQEFITLLPPDTTPGFPSRVCLLGNLVDAAEPAVSRSDSSIKLVKSYCSSSWLRTQLWFVLCVALLCWFILWRDIILCHFLLGLICFLFILFIIFIFKK